MQKQIENAEIDEKIQKQIEDEEIDKKYRNR